MAGVDESPYDKASNSCDVQEPGKHSLTILRQVEEGEQTEQRAEGDGPVRGAVSVGLLEDGRGEAFVSKGVQNASAGINVGASGRKHGSQQDGIDDIGKDLDAGKLGDNDERRGRGILSRALQVSVVIGNVDSDEEDGANEEDEIAPESPAYSLGNGLARILGLASTNTDKLGSLVAEASRDQDGPEADKLARGARHDVLCKGTRIRPIPEANIALVSSACIDTHAEDDEANHGHDLDAREPHFHLTKVPDGEEVDSSEDDPEDGNPDTNVDSLRPVLDDETGSCKFETKGNGPAEPVDPAHGKAQGGINKAARIDSEGTSNRHVGSHLTEGNHDGVNDETNEDEADE